MFRIDNNISSAKISVTLSKSNPSIGYESIPNNAAEVIMLANAM